MVKIFDLDKNWSGAPKTNFNPQIPTFPSFDNTGPSPIDYIYKHCMKFRKKIVLSFLKWKENGQGSGVKDKF